MSENERLIATLKALLKKQGYTYRRIGDAIALSEQSVKRLFSEGTFTLKRMLQLCELLGLSLAELSAQAEQGAAEIHTLSEAQETELAADPALLLVAVCALNGWRPADIVTAYRFTKAECLKKLLKLDRLGILTLLPGDRVRLNVARDFDWRRNGPIQRFFRKREKADFFASDFGGEQEQLLFLHGMLSGAAHARLTRLLTKLREDFAELHRESLPLPLSQKHGVVLLAAQREWEPLSFAELRRAQN